MMAAHHNEQNLFVDIFCEASKLQLHVSMDYVERNACVRIDIVQSWCIDN